MHPIQTDAAEVTGWHDPDATEVTGWHDPVECFFFIG